MRKTMFAFALALGMSAMLTPAHALTENGSYDLASPPACLNGSSIVVNGTCYTKTNGMELGGTRFAARPTATPKTIIAADEVAGSKIWLFACQDADSDGTCTDTEPRATSCGTGVLDLTGKGFTGTRATWVYVNMAKLNTSDPTANGAGCAGAVRGEIFLVWT